MSLPNDSTNDIMYYCYTKNNFVSSRSMIEFNSPHSIRFNKTQAITDIYLQVVCNRGRKHRKNYKMKSRDLKKLCQRVFSENPFCFKVQIPFSC